ncbi:hypothetical protein ACH4XT_02380 [Streptomyces avidinii]|uniref:hypothetical protein n=1 Tax=Streptomyces avidinii TaxID=1895 RepID=UPI003789B8DB
MLIERGHRVAVTGRNPDKLQAFLAESRYPRELVGIVPDASDWHATQAAAARTVDRFGALDTRGRQCRVQKLKSPDQPGGVGWPGLPRPAGVLAGGMPGRAAKGPLPHGRSPDSRRTILAGEHPPRLPDTHPGGIHGRTAPGPPTPGDSAGGAHLTPGVVAVVHDQGPAVVSLGRDGQVPKRTVREVDDGQWAGGRDTDVFAFRRSCSSRSPGRVPLPRQEELDAC